jgi:hypothetical protein
MSRMGSDFSTKQQIEAFRKKEQNELENRKAHFNQKVFILFLFILDGYYFGKN